MPFNVTCDGCGQSCAADEDLVGERVECPACGHLFVVPPHELCPHAVAGLLPAPPGPDVFAAPTHALRLLVPTVSKAFFGWADGCGLGRGPAAAGTAAVVLGVFGIVSPAPVRAAMLALPAWALLYLGWWLFLYDPAAARRRRRLPPSGG